MRRPLLDVTEKKKALLIKNRISAQKSFLKRKNGAKNIIISSKATSIVALPLHNHQVQVIIPSFSKIDI